jgi:hypothetical protein
MSRPATTRLKVNPPLGSLPVLQYCAPDQLRIDETYQRSLDAAASQTLIRRIAVHWDWGLCQPLFVARRADAGLYVVDGQHRLAAARLRSDIWQLPCVVTSFASDAEEAASFVALNQQRRPLTALDLFKAALAAGDEEAVAVMGAIRDAGLSLAGTTNNQMMKPGAIMNIGGILRYYRRFGDQVLRGALSAMAQAWPGERLQYAGTVFPGFAVVVADELRLRSSLAEVVEQLAALARSRSHLEWRKVIKASVGESGGMAREAAELVFRNAWRERNGARSAATITPITPPQRSARTFEEQMEAVARGAPICAKVDIARSAPNHTLGGVASGML